jgi:hypothetical protein
MGQRLRIDAFGLRVEATSETACLRLDSVQEGGYADGICHDHGGGSALRGE